MSYRNTGIVLEREQKFHLSLQSACTERFIPLTKKRPFAIQANKADVNELTVNEDGGSILNGLNGESELELHPVNIGTIDKLLKKQTKDLPMQKTGEPKPQTKTLERSVLL